MCISRLNRLCLLLTRFLLVAVAVCTDLPVRAQQFPYKKYGVYDGLNYANILSLHQDDTGRLWIGTVWGINFFEGGNQLMNYHQFPQLPDGYVDDMVTSPDGFVWASSGIHLRRYRKNNVALEKTEFQISYQAPNTRNRTANMAADHQNRLWYTEQTQTEALGRKLYCWENGQAKEVSYRLFAAADVHFRGLAADWPGERLLLVTENGALWEWKNNRLQEIRMPVPLSQLLTGPDGTIYGLSRQALYRINKENIHQVYTFPFTLADAQVCAVGMSGEIAFQEKDKAIYWYDGKNLTNSRLVTSQTNALLFDRQGNLWVGTRSNGLFQIKRNGWRFFDEADGFVESLNSIAEDPHGNIWLGASGKGLYKLAGSRIVPDSTYKKTIATDFFFPATRLDADRNVIFATENKRSVLRYNGQQYQLFPGTDTSAVARAFYDDKERNRYLLATYKGLYIYNRQTLHLDTVLQLPSGEYYAITPDKFGRFWISGSYASIRWDENKQVFRLLKQNDHTLPARHVYSTHKDEWGNLWLSTDNGLWHYNYREFRRIAPDYLQRTVLGAYPLKGYLFLGSMEGLFVLDVERFYRTGEEWLGYFDHQNSFNGSQCVFNGFLRDTQARVWIPTRDRMMMIPEADLVQLLKPVETGIRSMRDMSSGQVIPFHADILRFRSDQSDLEILLSEPDNKDLLANTLYSYRLERLDGKVNPPEWSEPVRENTILFRNLSDGSYRLTVKVLRANGLWHTQPLVQEFQIAPPWWATWWFRTALIFASVGALFYGRLRQVRALARRRLEALKTQRRLAQLEIEAANRQKQEAEIRQQLAEASRQRALLEVKAITNQIDPHFVSNFLMTIQSVAFESNPEIIISYLAKFGAIFRNKLLSRSKVFWSLGEEMEFVANYLELEKVRFGSRLEYTIQVSNDVPTDTQLPKMLIQGYVSNAIKHGLEHKPAGGRVIIAVCQKNEYLHITVEDDGVGLEKARLYRRRSTGQGLKINQAIFEQLNQYNTLQSWQHMMDMTDDQGAVSGVRIEACLPLQPILPPEELATSSN